MPKNKTHSGTKKRVKVTGSGKLTHAQGRQAAQPRAASRPAAPVGSTAAQGVAKVDAPRLARLLGI